MKVISHKEKKSQPSFIELMSQNNKALNELPSLKTFRRGRVQLTEKTTTFEPHLNLE